MRFYLLASVILSLILPVLIVPIEWSAKLIPTGSFPDTFLLQTKQAETVMINSSANPIHADSGISTFKTLLWLAIMIYAGGMINRCYLFVRNLIEIRALVKKSSKVKEGNYWIVGLKSEMPAFSFFNYIFINNTYKDLSSRDLQVIMKHEMVHVDQYHTLDILIVELVGIVFWFNPIVNYLRTSIKEIHEYAVDEKIAGHGDNKKAYAQLLLTLASDSRAFGLAAKFTGEHVKRRILMIAKPRTSRKKKLTFFVLLPLAAILSLSFSCLRIPQRNAEQHTKVAGIQLELKKYCGVYFPSESDINLGLKPFEIVLKNNKLFMEAQPGPANGTVELHFESDSIFSYSDNSARTVAFDLNSKEEVTGCALLKLETRRDSDNIRTYLVLKGDYLRKADK